MDRGPQGGPEGWLTPDEPASFQVEAMILERAEQPRLPLAVAVGVLEIVKLKLWNDMQDG